MNLGIFLSPGDNLTRQKNSGQLDRLINYYLKPYSKAFNQVYLFSYGDTGKKFSLPARVILVPKPILIPYQLYQFILPFLHQKTIKQINVFRVFQATGGLPALFINKPFIVTYGYHYGQFARLEGSPIKAQLMNWLVRPILKKAKKIIVTSKTNQAYLKNYQSKLKLIPNGVDPQVFKPSKTKPSKHLILTIGRLVHQKNHQLLLKAISQSKFKSKVKLIIIGQGRLKSQLIKLAKQEGIELRIIPQLPHQSLVKWYQSAGIFALTSKLEGQPKVLLEALSAGCACLTTPFEGNLIIHQQTGLTASTSKGLANQLDKLIKDQKLRRRLSYNGRQFIIKRFDIKKLVQQEIKLLKSCSN